MSETRAGDTAQYIADLEAERDALRRNFASVRVERDGLLTSEQRKLDIITKLEAERDALRDGACPWCEHSESDLHRELTAALHRAPRGGVMLWRDEREEILAAFDFAHPGLSIAANVAELVKDLKAAEARVRELEALIVAWDKSLSVGTVEALEVEARRIREREAKPEANIVPAWGVTSISGSPALAISTESEARAAMGDGQALTKLREIK
jgi:hypothetical protein